MDTPDNLFHTGATMREFFRDIANLTDTFRSLTSGAFKGITIKQADDNWSTDVSFLGGFAWDYLERPLETPLDESIDFSIRGFEYQTIDDVPRRSLDYFVVNVFFNYPPVNVTEMYKTLFAKYGYRIDQSEMIGSTRLQLRVKR